MFPRPIATREDGKVYRLTSSGSGRLLALLMDTLDGEIHLLEGTSLRHRGSVLLGAMRTARACAFSPDDAVLAAATRDDVVAFDLSSGGVNWKAALSGDEPAVTYSPDGLHIAVGAGPDSFRILEASSGQTVHSTDVGEEPRALQWDRDGLVAITQHRLVLANASAAPHATFELCHDDEEARELSPVGRERFAVAGSSAGKVWLEIRSRPTGAIERTMVLEGDLRAEGLVFSGGVLFLATEGGTYRIDPPFEQLVRWLPPLGGAHDPTRLATIAGAHVAIAARDIRLFRTRS